MRWIWSLMVSGLGSRAEVGYPPCPHPIPRGITTLTLPSPTEVRLEQQSVPAAVFGSLKED